MTIPHCSKLKDRYVIFLKPQVLEESAVSREVVLIEIVTDEGLRVFYHIMIHIEFIAHEVKGEGKADDEG